VQDSTSIKNAKDGRRTPTVYSLGNAVSNMSAKNTQLELMATVRIVRDADGQVRQLPMELTFLWCSRPGGYNDSYTVIPVEEYLDKAHLWTGEWDHSTRIYKQ
jgi:poly-gamma-glutamate synthesis protein (capsule biosynthesis protein)